MQILHMYVLVRNIHIALIGNMCVYSFTRACKNYAIQRLEKFSNASGTPRAKIINKRSALYLSHYTTPLIKLF